MGRTVCAAVNAAEDLELVGGFDRDHAGEALGPLVGLAGDVGLVYDDPAALVREAKPEVVVDFTLYPVSLAVARAAVEGGASPVIGVSGWSPEDEAEFATLCERLGVGAALVPNFALGAVLMMRFAEEAARYFPTVEIVELHHDRKLDKPSGTARLTARRIVAHSAHTDVPIHSVRLRGLVAHQEVLLGGEGEVLTIRHDSLSRDSFMTGVLLAIRRIRARRGLIVGLDGLLDGGAA
jgi:4-hydroxy-tetrahydrodipicolinate reductase